MDSRDASIQSQQGIFMKPSYVYPHQQQQHLQADPLTNSVSNLSPIPPTYAFNSASAPPFDASLLGRHHHHQQLQNGSPSGVTPRRGRPRKCSPDATGLVLSSSPHSGQKEPGEVNGGEGSQGRRQRGRPPGTGKKQIDALGGAAGSGFTPHVIKILPEEDIVSKMIEFCQEGPRTILILSTYGAVCNAYIRPQGATDESKPIHCEGCSDIISMSGPYFCMNYDGSHSNYVGLTVLLSTSDGKSLGGRVVGKLIAATNVQIIAASFIAEQKKSNASIPPVSSTLPTPVSHISNFGGSATANGAAQFDAATDSSDDNGASGSHSLSYTLTQGPYNNHPMHNMQTYPPHMGWGNSGMDDVHHNNG